jgi:hypothetical protein
MNNVKTVIGNLPPRDKKIGDMKPGDMGYIVPWAYDRETGNVRTDYTYSKTKGGTASVWIECVARGEYVIEFETPIYRNPFTGEYNKGE